MELNSSDLLIEPLIHEFTHWLGYKLHNEEFVMVYNTIYSKFMIERTESKSNYLASRGNREEVIDELKNVLRSGTYEVTVTPVNTGNTIVKAFRKIETAGKIKIR